MSDAMNHVSRNIGLLGRGNSQGQVTPMPSRFPDNCCNQAIAQVCAVCSPLRNTRIVRFLPVVESSFLIAPNTGEEGGASEEP